MPVPEGCQDSNRPRIAIVAGEESGDRLGAALIGSINRQGGANLSGVGGRDMAAAGIASPFSIDDLAIIGFSSIPMRLPAILRHIREAAEAVIAAHPDVLVIIDSPDFTHRVARRVRKALPDLPIIDYVSPSVWAWRPGRARRMRAYVDHVLALLPFEPAAHARLGGPPCTYVGHPLVEQVSLLRPGPEEARRGAGEPPLILVLPGSRSGEIRRHLALFGEAVALAAARLGPIEIVLPTMPHLAEAIRMATGRWRTPPRIVIETSDKWAAFRSARAALAASGTVTLELALSRIPTVVAYQVSLIEEIVARALIKVPSIVLANLVLGENVMPELLQRQATPQALADALSRLVEDTPERRRQLEAFQRIDEAMEIGSAQPSARAASIVLDAARRREAYLRREIG